MPAKRRVTTDRRSRVTIPGRPKQAYTLQEFDDGRIVLEPVKRRQVTPTQLVLAARIVVNADAQLGRASDPEVIALAKERIFSPYGGEIRFEWPKAAVAASEDPEEAPDSEHPPLESPERAARKLPKRRAHNVTHNQRVLAARILITADAKQGRESRPEVVALAKKRIFSPYGSEIRFRRPARAATKDDDEGG